MMKLKKVLKRMLCITTCFCIIMCSYSTAYASKTKKIEYYHKDGIQWLLQKYSYDPSIIKFYKKCKYFRHVRINGSKLDVWVSKGKKTSKKSYKLSKKAKFVCTFCGNNNMFILKKGYKVKNPNNVPKKKMTYILKNLKKGYDGYPLSFYNIEIYLKSNTVTKVVFCFDGGDPTE